MGSLTELAAGRTSVFVAHRLSTIQGCDKIYVLSEGRVEEEGSHEELVEKKGLYWTQWQAQAAEEVRAKEHEMGSGDWERVELEVEGALQEEDEERIAEASK